MKPRSAVLLVPQQLNATIDPVVKLASRALQAAESATIGLSRRVAELKASGRDLVDLGAGEPDAASPPAAVQAAIEALRSGFTRYTAVDGVADLRRELAAHYAVRGGPWNGDGDALITVGAKSALLQLVLAVAQEGDEVVIPSPCWVSLPAQVRLAGAEPILVARCAQAGFAFSVEQLLAACNERTRLILLNTPCNPTGAVMGTQELQRLAEAAAQRDILLAIDATYEHFDYARARGAAHPVSVARRYPEHVAYVSSFSKAYAMTGWRVGYAFGPRELMRAMRMVQSHATTHATSFAMWGALAALRSGSREAAALVARCRANRDLLVPALDALDGVRCPMPEGAFYALPDVSALLAGREVTDSTSFAEKLLEEEGVAVVPGAAFAAEGHVRISFAAPTEVVHRGLEGIRRFAGRLAGQQAPLAAGAPSPVGRS